MSEKSSMKCPQCGAPLAANAIGGLCPRCLMALNLKTETVFTDDRAAAQPPLPPEQIAPHFPQLEILECLGRGGMGVVYKARQKTLNRFVALKLLAPERAQDAQFAERFAREAQALAALNHPNIVTIYDFGQAGGFYFLLMEFVDGMNLRQLLRTHTFTPEEALAIVPVLCDALQFAHDRGIVHRDIKPENLLMAKDGRVKVADFGIAKMLGASNDEPGAPAKNVTQSGLGTPGYSAPEQKSDPRRADSRADIYSLGVVFYEMLTGELPGKLIEPPSRKVQIDVRLDEVVLRALEKKPELRYQHASALKTEVETIAATPRGEGENGKAETGKPGPLAAAPANRASLYKSKLRKSLLIQLPIAVALALLLWTYVVQSFVAATDAAAPEIPRGSHFLVWKLAHHFASGDLIAYRHEGRVNVGRVVGNVGDDVSVNRNGEGDALIPRGHILGKVISVYWRASREVTAASGAQTFYIGRTSFPLGDSIEIKSLTRNAGEMTVTGHYRLVSHGEARLALHITTSLTNQNRQTEPSQEMKIQKGEGDFTLIHSHASPGRPHVAMYADGTNFADVYFGTSAEPAEPGNPGGSDEAKNGMPPRNPEFPRDAWVGSSGAWTNWNNHQQLGSFYAVAGGTNEIVAVGTGGRIARRPAATGVWQVE